MKFTLTQKEKDLIVSIKNFVIAKKLDITPRIAGGWVRDKLLNIHSSDIDIVLDNMSGLEFAKVYKQHMDLVCNHVSDIGIIKENPAQSKHIETAAVRIFGIFVDFLQLRSEEYTIEKQPDIQKETESNGEGFYGDDVTLLKKKIDEKTLVRDVYSTQKPSGSRSIYESANLSDASLTSTSSSRIPVIKPACLIEDALRRDITINTLYFNIMTNEIEDMTGKGFEDIKRKTIRTPLEPYKTFMDDPLRILRVIRFSVRFNYKIQNNIIEAFKDANVRSAFVYKISRERVGTEITKIIKYKDGMLRICEYGLHDVVFAANEKTHCDALFSYFKSLNNELRATRDNEGVDKDCVLDNHAICTLMFNTQPYDDDNDGDSDLKSDKNSDCDKRPKIHTSGSDDNSKHTQTNDYNNTEQGKHEPNKKKTGDVKFARSCQEANEPKANESDNISEVEQSICEIKVKKLSKKIKITGFVVKNAEKKSDTVIYPFDIEYINLFAYMYFFIGQKHEKEYFNAYICKEKLKLPNAFTKIVCKIEDNISYIKNIIETGFKREISVSIELETNKHIESEEIGFNIQRILGDFAFDTNLHVKIRILLIKIVRFCKAEFINTFYILKFHNYQLEILQKLYDLVKIYKYENCFDTKPLIDGHKIKKVFSIGGAEIRRMLERSIIMQILYEITSEDVLIEHLRTNKE